MAEYAPEVLRRLRSVEEDIAREFARVCDALNLSFFAAYGTALGAVRHGGFIPWDDDMDFVMPRADYETLILRAPALLGARYALLEPRTTAGYVMPFAKLTRADTTFVEATDQDRRYHSGIFIDIFPFDLMYTDTARRQKVLRRCWLLARLCVLREYPTPKLPAGTSGAKASALRGACRLAHGLLLLTGQSTARLYACYLRAVQAPARAGASGVYADALLYRNELNYGAEDVLFPEEMLFPVQDMPFDGMELPLPRDWDGYLALTFGDYMQLPPEDQRHTHAPAVLKFEE